MADGAITRILGLDPGTARTGYGLIERDGQTLRAPDYGLLTTLSGTPQPDRLQELAHDLEELLRETKPDAVAVEQLYFSTNTKTALSVAEARGVILLVCANADLPIAEYTPQQVKQAVSTYGGAGKAQVATMVTKLLELPETPSPDDVTDALAVSICHSHTMGAS